MRRQDKKMIVPQIHEGQSVTSGPSVRISISEAGLLIGVELQVRDAEVERMCCGLVGDDLDPEADGFHRERVEVGAARLPTAGLQGCHVNRCWLLRHLARQRCAIIDRCTAILTFDFELDAQEKTVAAVHVGGNRRDIAEVCRILCAGLAAVHARSLIEVPTNLSAPVVGVVK